LLNVHENNALGDKPKQMRALTTFPVLSAGNYGAGCKTGLLSSTIQVLQVKSRGILFVSWKHWQLLPN